MLGPLAGFVLILALIPVALWLLKRTPLGGGGARAAGMRVVGTLPLSPSQRLVTVEVGQGDERRWLVLGVTPAGISTLHNMAPSTEVAGPASPTGLPKMPGFAQIFQHERGTAPKTGAPGPDGDRNGR